GSSKQAHFRNPPKLKFSQQRYTDDYLRRLLRVRASKLWIRDILGDICKYPMGVARVITLGLIRGFHVISVSFRRLSELSPSSTSSQRRSGGRGPARRPQDVGRRGRTPAALLPDIRCLPLPGDFCLGPSISPTQR